jgi:adenylate kinase
MNVVLFGKPGAGKGTQAPRLAAALGVPAIATGDVLRSAVREGTTLGKEAKAYMDRGDLVPDDVILGILKEALSDAKFAKGAILDGVVRTVPQADGLNRVLEQLGRELDAVLIFDIEDDELVRRLGGRVVCGTCQTPYTGHEAGEACTQPGCPGKLVRRKDDEPEAVRNRLAVYERQTAPVLDHYRGLGACLASVKAAGEIDEITHRALQALDQCRRSTTA